MNELPGSAMGVLKIMPSTASEVARFSKQLVESVKSGNSDPLELIVQLHALTKVYELVREEIEDNINKAADKYSEKRFAINGAFVEKAELGTKYRYETSKDIEWERLNTDFETAKARKSEREDFLKTLREPMTLVNQETGEVYTVKPPLKTSKTGVKFYLK